MALWCRFSRSKRGFDSHHPLHSSSGPARKALRCCKRLASVLGEIGYLSVKGKVSKVPTDCIACHEKTVGTKFGVLVHQAHSTAPGRNAFVQHFGEDCRHCHAMVAQSGEPKVKVGDANW